MGTETKTAAALGFFDGMHIGHAAVISTACRAAETYGFTPAAFMIREAALPKFGGRTDVFLTTYEDKVTLLERHFGINYIYAPYFEDIRGLAPEEFFERILKGIMNIGYVCCGEDFRFGKDGAGTAGLLREMCAKSGIAFGIVPPVRINGETVSSTMLRAMIREGRVAEADSLMLRPASYIATVTKGRQLGRTIGFPTINQMIPDNAVRPKRGVYASRVMLDGVKHPAITNIGVKPTVKSDDTENMETHIIGFDGDLYGQKIRVCLLDFIRDERRFDSLADLKEQLISDKSISQTIFNERLKAIS